MNMNGKNLEKFAQQNINWSKTGSQGIQENQQVIKVESDRDTEQKDGINSINYRTLSVCLVSLGGLYSDYMAGKLLLPEHQQPRSDVGACWSNAKKKRWISRIKNVGTQDVSASQKCIGGLVTTYHLEGRTENTPKFLNDGAHRAIHAISWYVSSITPNKKIKQKNPKVFKSKQTKLKKFMDILNEVKIAEEYKVYKDEYAAMDDFISINLEGSLATCYQVFTGRMKGTIKKIWGVTAGDIFKLIERIENAIPDGLKSLNYEAASVGAVLADDSESKRNSKQKYARDSRASFLRHVNNLDIGTPFKGITKTRLTNPKSNKGHRKIEKQIVSFFKDNNYQDCVTIVEQWEKFVTEAFAFLKQIILEKKLSPMELFGTELGIRWWFSTYIYLRNNDATVSYIRKFTEKFVDFKGSSSFLYLDPIENIEKLATAQLQTFSQLYLTAYGLGPLEKKDDKCRKKSDIQPIAGCHNSHVKSFSIHGEGESLSENAIENRERGARDMTPEEYKRNLLANGKTIS